MAMNTLRQKRQRQERGEQAGQGHRAIKPPARWNHDQRRSETGIEVIAFTLADPHEASVNAG